MVKKIRKFMTDEVVGFSQPDKSVKRSRKATRAKATRGIGCHLTARGTNWRTWIRVEGKFVIKED